MCASLHALAHPRFGSLSHFSVLSVATERIENSPAIIYARRRFLKLDGAAPSGRHRWIEVTTEDAVLSHVEGLFRSLGLDDHDGVGGGEDGDDKDEEVDAGSCSSEDAVASCSSYADEFNESSNGGSRNGDEEASVPQYCPKRPPLHLTESIRRGVAPPPAAQSPVGVGAVPAGGCRISAAALDGDAAPSTATAAAFWRAAEEEAATTIYNQPLPGLLTGFVSAVAPPCPRRNDVLCDPGRSILSKAFAG